ncbi:MAG: hypothetical protein R6U96_17290 [Promethearchaeia archaeon]
MVKKIFSKEINYDQEIYSVYFVVALLFDKFISLDVAEITLKKRIKELKTNI